VIVREVYSHVLDLKLHGLVFIHGSAYTIFLLINIQVKRESGMWWFEAAVWWWFQAWSDSEFTEGVV
jgi:hypothetical protein